MQVNQSISPVNIKKEHFSAHKKSEQNSCNNESRPQPLSNKQKLGIFTTTLLGVGTALAFILKGKKDVKYALNLKKIFNTAPSKWGIFNAVYKDEEIPWMVIKLGVGSVAGGLLGGALFDKKENMKAKIRESIIQLIGNIGTPLACVYFGMKGFKKIEPKIQKFLPTAKSIKTNKIIKGIPGVFATGLSLCIGIVLGNKVGNLLNEKIFHVKDNRKLKLSDMSPHLDDLCVAVTIAGSENPVIPRFIPAALMIAGFSAGTAQEKPERLNHKVKQEPVT